MNYLRYFSRKSWLVAGDHMTNTTPPISYASVLYFGTACIALIIADLDYLEVRVYIIINAYITDSVTEKICTIMSLDFGEGHRNMDLILRSLYRLNSARENFSNHIEYYMSHISYTTCLADPK